ncbi:uncharacterized protein LOC117334405 isoform X4 [Pecten maximus]|uniref:uncharacterized protein LOC117334405 isoform X4 n=1 Tax=Pecten maximus TaxID=6579 RepID=UPI0014587426|nr:uncharacterized protein LOC117334405 isoform X4 [Pecten maximus]
MDTKVVFVPVGQAINRVFLADMAERADGCIAEIEDLSNVKKHFLCHYTIAKVIGICRDIDFEDLFMNVMDNEAAALLSSTWSDTPFTETDVIMMKREFEKSEELKDIEYPHLNLPPIGSRVSIPAYSQSSYVSLPHFGTVIQQKSTGTIKVEWDAGMITFLDWNKDMKRLGIRTVKEPRHLTHGSLIDVGVAVTKAHKVTGQPSDTVQGRVFLTTNNGYVKVRWDDGTIGRHKYGADATFDLHIALESYPLDSYVWQYKEDNGSWVTYPTGDLSRIENAVIKRNKTVITNSGRIIFNKMTETLTRGEQKRQRDVRRIIVAEMIE